MGLHNTENRWGWPAKTLHWVIAILIIGLLVVGTYMTGLVEGMERFELTQLHKSFGFLVFVLACARVIWRWASPKVPGLPADTPRFQVLAVQMTHFGLYALMFLLPLSGWLMASASPLNDPDAYIYIKNEVFGLFELPDPIHPGDKSLETTLAAIHEYAGYALAVLLALHVGGALFHHFVEKDNVLTRMLPFGRD